MNEVLEKVKSQTGGCCVTIMLNTHRTLPDNEKDPLVLKNLVKEAEKRIAEECEGEQSKSVLLKLHNLLKNIDHRHNMESLVIFVNENFSDFARLPVTVENKVVIGKSFATRELIRVMLRQTSYYVLLLSRSNARLIEAKDNFVVREIGEPFPIENTLHPVQASEAAIANRINNLGSTFFNEVEKQMNMVIKDKTLPVVVYSDSSNYHEFLRVADNRDLILGNVTGKNKMNEKNYHIIEAVWPKVKKLVNERNKNRLKELKEAVNHIRFVTDFNEIWKTIQRGRGRTLFIRQGYFQPARIIENVIHLAAPNEANEPGVVEDVIDVLLEKNIEKGGDAVFISNGDLDQFQGLVLTTKS